MKIEPMQCPELSASADTSPHVLDRLKLLLGLAKGICQCQSLEQMQETVNSALDFAWHGSSGFLWIKDGLFPWEAVAPDATGRFCGLDIILKSLNGLAGEHWIAKSGGLLKSTDTQITHDTPAPASKGSVMVQPVIRSETEACLLLVCSENQDAFSTADLTYLCHISEIIQTAVHRCLAEERLERSEDQLHRAVQQLPAILWTTDADLNFTHLAGKGLESMDIHDEGRWKGISLRELLGDTLLYPVAYNAHQQALEGHSATYEYEFSGRHYQCQVQPITGRNQSIHGVVGLAHDISDWKNAELRLQQQAYYDGLTGLPNRAVCLDWMERALQPEPVGESESFALLFLDLDRFKNVNDSLGHAAGDELLKLVGTRLRGSVKSADIVARIGGDEFAVLLPRTRTPDAALAVAERIVSELDRPFSIDGNTVYCGVSVGVAMSRPGHKTPNDVLQDADLAMYQAKQSGRGRFSLFDEHMHDRVVDYVRTETQLRQGIERNELEVYYQPILSLDSAALCGMEALVRWNHPDGRVLAPESFLTIAEDTGLVIPIGRIVLENACRQLRQWQVDCVVSQEVSISVNISARHFREESLLTDVGKVLQETGLDPACLRLEITEGTVMQNAESTTAMLLQLRALNVQLNIDDFGTGYSSLSYLTRYPIDALKIDKSFIFELGTKEDAEEIVRTVVSMSANLRMESIAEGIESVEQLASLREMGCQFGQGNLFSPPLPAGELRNVLSQGFLRN